MGWELVLDSWLKIGFMCLQIQDDSPAFGCKEEESMKTRKYFRWPDGTSEVQFNVSTPKLRAQVAVSRDLATPLV